MSEIQLQLAPRGSQKEGCITLQEPILASKLGTYEVLHITLNGDGIALIDGATAHGYSYQGGTLIECLAVSREVSSTFDIELGIALYSAFPTFTKISASAPIAVSVGQKGRGILTTWDCVIPPLSFIQAKQVSALPVAALVIDVFLVILHA